MQSMLVLGPDGWALNPELEDDYEPPAVFPVPDRAEALGLTHGLVAYHTIKGWLLLRWLKADVSEEKARADAARLYGAALNSFKAVPLH